MTKITKTPSPTMFSAEHCIHFTETETESRRDEDENIQSKNGPLRVHRMNSKLRN